MKTIIAIFLIFLISHCTYSQSSGRDVAWAHGLGEGGQDVWSFYRSIFTTERQMDGHESDYSSSVGVNSASTEVKNEWISNSNVNPTSANNIGIGHSLGGIVLRDIERDFPATFFGGIITVGSPNKGADIVNSIDNGKLTEAIKDGTSRMTAGPLAELASLLGPLYPFLSSFVNPLIDDAILAQIVGPISNIKGTQSFTDLAANGTYINTLNSNNSNIPRISIWGTEQSPVHWRIASSFASDRENDKTFVDLANGVEAIYTGFALTNSAQTLLGGIGCIFNPFACISAINHAQRAIKWNKGRVWLRQSEDMWLELINCNEFSSSINETTVLIDNYQEHCAGFMTGSPEWVACIYEWCDGDVGNGCMEEVTLTNYVFTGLKSDGLLCGSTQIGDNIAQGDRFEAMGVNHAEETNTSSGTTLNGNDEMQRIFNLIWDRPTGDFFRTSKR